MIIIMMRKTLALIVKDKLLSCLGLAYDVFTDLGTFEVHGELLKLELNHFDLAFLV